MLDAPAMTSALADFALGEPRFSSEVREAGIRSFFNVLGCTLGGAHHRATEIAYGVAKEFAGAPATTLLGRGRLVDALNGAYLNCLAASAHAFDDTHLATVVHPSAPIASALLALAERAPLTGDAFLQAFIIGVEIQCRIGMMLFVAPAQGQWGWYASGVAGGIGAAAAGARALGLSSEQTRWAIGLAANQASGFRQTHGTMCTSFIPAHASRSGLQAALLAAAGFTASDSALEGTNGFCDVFSHRAHRIAATNDLGSEWEILRNTFKPYPCGIVIHPVLDACLKIARDYRVEPTQISAVTLDVDPLCLTLCDRPTPDSDQLAQVSVQHWAAAALVRGSAGLREGANECVLDPTIISVRQKVDARPHPTVGRDGAQVTVRLLDGTSFTDTVEHCTGSLARPMTNAELEAKFNDQAMPLLGPDGVAELIHLGWSVDALDDMNELIRATVPSGREPATERRTG